MPPHHPQAVPPFETLTGIAGLPDQLAGNPRRQAVPAISGTVYQAWWSIDAWLRLDRADEVIYLEGAEDYDIVRSDSAITVQVKQNAGSISLGNAKAHEALENFWALSCKEPSRRIVFHYLTTSSIAMEQDVSFDELRGIEAWSAAQTNPELAVKIARYLKEKLPITSSLRAFLAAATPDVIQQRLIKRFYWLTSQPEIDVVKCSVDDRIAVLLAAQRRSTKLTSSVRKYLESRFWEVVLDPSSTRRCLTYGDLLRQVEAATTAHLSIPIDQLPDLIGTAPPGLNLLKLLIRKSRRPPDLLLQRPALMQRLEELVKQRRVILLTGSVYKGKTTLAQLVVSRLCPDAWWINLTERKLREVDILFLALAGQIESGDCPSLVVIDDLDISPIAHRAYRDSLALVLHRANATGHSLILTAQGASSDSAIVQDLSNVELFDVPEVSDEETIGFCLEHGCPEELSKVWGSIVKGTTRGHPKLVQVRIAELAARSWTHPSPNDLIVQSSKVVSVRQEASRLLSDSVSSPVAEFVYMVSECSVLMHRSVAIRLCESIDGLTNAGNILQDLTGKWLERIEGAWFRATALLSGVAAEIWSPDKRKSVHIQLHDAIREKQQLDPFEAAALLFHAFMGQERTRLAHTAIRLQMIENHDARHEVERQLLWLPLVALESGQTITDDVTASVLLRQLQFRAASTLNSDTLSQICERWSEDIARISLPEVKSTMLTVMWSAIGSSQSLKVPLRIRLEAIAGIRKLPDDLQEFQDDRTRNLLERDDIAGWSLPANGTTAQMMFLFANRSLRDTASLDELLQWLDNVATQDLREQFDAMLEWPIVQSLGAFVQGAWAAKHEETQDWDPWLALFERIDDYAKRRASPRFGREAAKARAIILTEYLSRSEDALVVLDQADTDFGVSAVLLEQRANVLFYRQDDEMVLNLWSQLTSDPASQVALDPFAYRRAGISAARLKRWAEAEQIFLAAITSLAPGSLDLAKFGLQVDAALVVSLGGNQAAAAKILVEAVLTLPSEAALEGDQRWEAVQRAAVAVGEAIEKSHLRQEWGGARIQPGDASSPVLKASKAEVGQPARSEMTRVQTLRLAASLGVAPPSLIQELKVLAGSRYILVRWFASQASLAHSYGSGAGMGFVGKLLALETAVADLSTKRQGLSPLEPDAGPSPNQTVAPERWFGLLAAGIICSGNDLLAKLDIWRGESREALGIDAPLTKTIQLCIDGASCSAEIIEETIHDTTKSASVRCGAAAQLLLTMPSANKTLQFQQFLASALVSDSSVAFQELFNLHVARCFASAWRVHVEHRFQFSSPRTSVPALLLAIEEVESGNGTLNRLLRAAADALSQPLDDFMEGVS